MEILATIFIPSLSAIICIRGALTMINLKSSKHAQSSARSTVCMHIISMTIQVICTISSHSDVTRTQIKDRFRLRLFGPSHHSMTTRMPIAYDSTIVKQHKSPVEDLKTVSTVLLVVS